MKLVQSSISPGAKRESDEDCVRRPQVLHLDELLNYIEGLGLWIERLRGKVVTKCTA